MGLNKMIGSSLLQRYSWFIILILFTFFLTGCGESEEAVYEEPQVKEEETSDQALTNFIGADTGQTDTSHLTLAQSQKQIQELRTENTSLKQNIIRLEQENRNVNARLTEVNAKYMSENFRSDSAEMTGKSRDVSSTSGTMNEEPLPPSQATYDDAIIAFRAQRYDFAVKGFRAIVDGGGEDELVGRSRYWLGEAYFAQKDYKDALQLFQDVLKMKNSDKKADAQYMLARAYENLGNKVKAKAAYEKVVKNYPMSKNVKSAKTRWAKL